MREYRFGGGRRWRLAPVAPSHGPATAQPTPPAEAGPPCRVGSTSSSASLDTVERSSRTSHPPSRTTIRESGRMDTADHHLLPLAQAHHCGSQARPTSGTPQVFGAIASRRARVASRSVGGARRKREVAWVWEAEAGVAGRTFGQGRCEYSGAHVVVVVNLGGGLAGVGAQDPAGVLDEAAFECDRRGEEQGVEGWAVEAFANIGTGGDHEQWRAVRLGL
jgi:hypothetical protein